MGSFAATILPITIVMLLLLFVFSFSLFVRRLLINRTEKNKTLLRIERKLDKIITIEEQKNNL